MNMYQVFCSAKYDIDAEVKVEDHFFNGYFTLKEAESVGVSWIQYAVVEFAERNCKKELTLAEAIEYYEQEERDFEYSCSIYVESSNYRKLEYPELDETLFSIINNTKYTFEEKYQMILDVRQYEERWYDLSGDLVFSKFRSTNFGIKELQGIYHENLRKYKKGDIVILIPNRNEKWRTVAAVIMDDFVELQNFERPQVWGNGFQFEGVYLDSGQYWFENWLNTGLHEDILGYYEGPVPVGSILWYMRKLVLESDTLGLNKEEVSLLYTQEVVDTEFIVQCKGKFTELPTIKNLLEQMRLADL